MEQIITLFKDACARSAGSNNIGPGHQLLPGTAVAAERDRAAHDGNDREAHMALSNRYEDALRMGLHLQEQNEVLAAEILQQRAFISRLLGQTEDPAGPSSAVGTVVPDADQAASMSRPALPDPFSSRSSAPQSPLETSSLEQASNAQTMPDDGGPQTHTSGSPPGSPAHIISGPPGANSSSDGPQHTPEAEVAETEVVVASVGGDGGIAPDGMAVDT